MTIGGAITQNCVQNGIAFPPFRSSNEYSEKNHKKQQKKLHLRFYFLAFIFSPDIFLKICMCGVRSKLCDLFLYSKRSDLEEPQKRKAFWN